MVRNIFGPSSLDHSFLPFGLSSFVSSDHPCFVFWAVHFWFPARLLPGTIKFLPFSFILDCLFLVFWIDKFNHQIPYTLIIGRLWDLTPIKHSTENIPTTLSYFWHYKLIDFFNFICTDLVPNFPTSFFPISLGTFQLCVLSNCLFWQRVTLWFKNIFALRTRVPKNVEQ